MAGNPFDKTSKSGGGSAATATKTKGGLDAANGDGDPAPAAGRAAAAGDPFDTPSGGGDYKFAEWLGELLLIEPLELDQMVTRVSKGQLQDFVLMNVIRLDNENERCDDVISFHQAIYRTLKKTLRGPNDWTLGRLEMGEEKNGNNAPYILSKPTPEEAKHAKAVMAELGLL